MTNNSWTLRGVLLNSLMFEVLFLTEDQNCCSSYSVRTFAEFR